MGGTHASHVGKIADFFAELQFYLHKFKNVMHSALKTTPNQGLGQSGLGRCWRIVFYDVPGAEAIFTS